MTTISHICLHLALTRSALAVVSTNSWVTLFTKEWRNYNNIHLMGGFSIVIFKNLRNFKFSIRLLKHHKTIINQNSFHWELHSVELKTLFLPTFFSVSFKTKTETQQWRLLHLVMYLNSFSSALSFPLQSSRLMFNWILLSTLFCVVNN